MFRRLGFGAILLGLCCATPAFAITWCHDYSLWEASGRSIDKDRLAPSGIESESLERQLDKLDYVLVKVFAPNSANADDFLQPGDVVVMGTAHSGYVNAQRKIDHLIQPPGAPGTRMSGDGAMASPNFKRAWTLAQLWGPIERTDSQGNVYRNAPYGGASASIYRKAQLKQELPGSLTKGMAKDSERKNCYARAYPFNFESGKIYTLDLVSGDGKRGPHNPGYFDTWLRIEDASGKALASNDDGGEGFNARIVFTATTVGPVRLIVTSYGSEATGSYVLTVRR